MFSTEKIKIDCVILMTKFYSDFRNNFYSVLIIVFIIYSTTDGQN